MSFKREKDTLIKTMAEDVTRAIERNVDGSSQGDQVTLLMKLEDQFKNTLAKYSQLREIYRLFILKVAVENKNILSARPFFREKSKTFSSRITPAIKTGNIKALQAFHINYLFIEFIRQNWKGPFPQRAQEKYEKIIEVRTKLVENNTPLSMNRAKLFHRKVPQSHMELGDMVGEASLGLLSGIDKWVGDYSKVFNGVCIGRMTGNLIDSYSETTLHFYPSDRSILYRANSLRFRNNISDMNELVQAINKSYEEDRKNGIKTPRKEITVDELVRLMSAASPVSADTPADAESNSGLTLLDYQQDQSDNQEESLLKNDLKLKMIQAARNIPVIQRKVLRLKGVKI